MKILKAINRLVDSLMVLAITLALALAVYGLWDSHHVVQGALASNYTIYMPDAVSLAVGREVSGDAISADPQGASGFEVLQALNPDVVGWISLYGTPIDYPIVQGIDNMDYVNMNPLGEYSLTGSIFLDSDNASDFSDFNSILYGHNMMPEVMFGNVKEYRSETYFDSHRYGMLYYGGRAYGLNIFAMIEADAYDDSVYRPGVPEGEESSYLETLLERALVDRSGDIGGVQAEAEAEAQAGLDSIDWGEERILLLSTCTAGLTNGRYLLIARISEETYENPYLTEGGEGSLGAGQLLLYGIGILALAGLVLILLLLRRRRRRRAAAESRD